MQASATVSPRSLPTTLAAQEEADGASVARRGLSETNISLGCILLLANGHSVSLNSPTNLT